MKKTLPILLSIVALVGCAQKGVTRFVDPYIGTTGFGNIFLAANVPFGFTQVGPTEHSRPPGGGEWTSGYNYSDSLLIGFGHLHLSGTGCGDLGDISLLPTWDKDMREVLFRHDEEIVGPGYYSIDMKQTGIRAEMTATCHTGFHRYTFPRLQDTAKVILNLRQGIGYDRVTECSAEVESDRIISGRRYSNGWTKNEKLYYTMEFSAPIVGIDRKDDSVAVFSFLQKDAKPLLVKVGLSGVSVDNAKLNLAEENPGWDFDEIADAADKAWEAQLGKIQIKTDDEVARRIFYTSLFHTMVCPSVYTDVNGDYRGVDGQIHNDGHTNYTTFSFWDTARAVHPLATLIHPDRQADWAQTMLESYQTIGTLPYWPLMGCEMFSMGRCFSITVMCDLMSKGFVKDMDAAYAAITGSSLIRSPQSMAVAEEYGYFPYDKINERVSDGLDISVIAGAVARKAKELGHDEDYEHYYRLSQGYRHYFDPSIRFMRPVDSEGKFLEPFDPCAAPQKHAFFGEGNSWMWTWHVMHDIPGLIEIMGGDEDFTEKLDSLFIVEGGFGKPNTVNHTGVIGQFYQGNEHSNHIPYLYSYAGKPWMSAYWVRQTMDRLYSDKPDGICGNDDAGALSAWYVLSALGLYQVNPAVGRFVFGTPIFDNAKLDLGNGQCFEIQANGVSHENIYIQSVTLNGEPYTKSYIDYEDIVKGGVLTFNLGPTPSSFGTALEDRP